MIFVVIPHLAWLQYQFQSSFVLLHPSLFPLETFCFQNSNVFVPTIFYIFSNLCIMSCIPSELKTFAFFNTSILHLFFLNSMPMPLLDVCTVYTRLSSCSLNNNCLVSYIIQILKEINCLLKKFSFDLYSSLYLAIQCQLHSPNSYALH